MAKGESLRPATCSEPIAGPRGVRGLRRTTHDDKYTPWVIFEDLDTKEKEGASSGAKKASRPRHAPPRPDP